MIWNILVIIASTLLVMLGATLEFVTEFAKIDCWK